ncbi:protein of unknown function DUF4396 [Desulfovibrio sp. X2]|uniref:DUF4396 domain-containing protein n=1 Tax=Desulfovibrio sp. X2 TaxID=941449 RepID=UPI00035874EE|nr:DUF4396 domain-containing protein [Desulfovibrio sp. X2]EPR43629.1 protein of unknown function DUF4396 [Desulfovibrio sp. X2]
MSHLAFLANPAFVIVWYGFGLLAAVWVTYDVLRVNTHVMPALKAGWPIIVTFFSIIGLGLYLASCRPPGIASLRGEEADEIHHAYVSVTWKRVTGSVIHCVGGDGLGVVTAMVVARLAGFSFWHEFWFEYAVGFVFGWFVFQYLSMRKMGHPPLESLWKGGRAEFFSMLTVMLGMGLVMRFVTPTVVGHRPLPDEAAFWGFASLGLFVGAIVTYPMNWWMVAVGWKHGMG